MFTFLVDWGYDRVHINYFWSSSFNWRVISNIFSLCLQSIFHILITFRLFPAPDFYLTDTFRYSNCITTHRYSDISIIVKNLAITSWHPHASPQEHIAYTFSWFVQSQKQQYQIQFISNGSLTLFYKTCTSCSWKLCVPKNDKLTLYLKESRLNSSDEVTSQRIVRTWFGTFKHIFTVIKFADSMQKQRLNIFYEYCWCWNISRHIECSVCWLSGVVQKHWQ